MSKAGKFIPGGGGSGKTPVKGARTGPIRAPDANAGGAITASSVAGTGGTGAPKPFTKQSLVKSKVAKNRQLPIVIMSAMVCCLLISVAWYTLAYLPAIRSRDAATAANLALAKQLADEQAAEKQRAEDLLKAQQAARGSLTVDSSPTGAKVTIGDFEKTTPATFTDMVPGTFPIVIKLDGYEEYRQDVTVTVDKPVDLGTITLAEKSGTISFTSPQSDVTYKVTGPNSYDHEGSFPDKLTALPVGDYSLTVSQKDWTLPAIPFTIRDHDNLAKDIKFPYANVTLTTSPSGATVRDGRDVLGQTPLTLSQIRPTDLHLSVDLAPYTLQRIDVHVPDFGNVNKQVTLSKDKDFIAASGIPMVWISDGGFWAGKYLVRQSDFEAAGGNDPSSFRRPTRPVDSITWEAATAFCDMLTAFEKKAGKLPAGYHYALPKESQWELFSADANIDLAATSRINTLASTQDVGYSEANKYGIYDSIGNVWEWCADTDDKGNHSVRGGDWLSSTTDFPNAETRNVVLPKYTDRFTGFRVVLVPN